MIIIISYCPFCRRAKNQFEELGVPYFAMELDQREDGTAIQQEVQRITGIRTVPVVFVQGELIGDSGATVRARLMGRFDPLTFPRQNVHTFFRVAILFERSRPKNISQPSQQDQQHFTTHQESTNTCITSVSIYRKPFTTLVWAPCLSCESCGKLSRFPAKVEVKTQLPIGRERSQVSKPAQYP
eukprot:g65652.t1